MEISGAAVLRRSPTFAAGGGARRWGGRFSDEGHVRYYVQPVRCGGGKKEEKRRAKLVKELSKDLSKFYSIGFGVAEGGGDVNEKMMSEAADLLLSQLKQLKTEEKEFKRKRKEQKAAMKQAKKEAKMVGCNSEDSSSSSESSCSGCESVDRTSNLRKSNVIEPQTENIAVPVATERCSAAVLSNLMTSGANEPMTIHLTPTERDINAVAERIEVFMGHQTPTERYSNAVAERIEMFMGGKCVTEPIAIQTPTERYSNAVAERIEMFMEGKCVTEPIAIQTPTERCGNAVTKRIEVCMGGKCKKSGAMELMAEFEKMVGVEGAVVGCKCMGKCKDGPNVRVNNGKEEEIGVSGNPLCIGVGLEDVGFIVASFLGEEGGGVLGCYN